MTTLSSATDSTPTHDESTFRSRDMTQASFQERQGGVARKRKRNRETLSCSECRQRKIACDRAQPCSNCVRFKRPDSCAYTSGAAAATTHTDVATFGPDASPAEDSIDSIQERMAFAERMLQSLQSHSKGSTPPGHSPTAYPDWRKPPNGSINASINASERAPVENIFCKGRLSVKNKTQYPYYIGPTAWTITGPMDVFSEHQDNFREILMPQWKRFNAICQQFPPSPHDTILNLISPTPTQDVFAELQATFPSSNDCRILVSRFLDSFNEVYPIVVRQTFEKELSAFLSERWTADPYWLALLAAIVAVGYMIPVHALSDGSWKLKPGDARRLALLAQQQCFIAAASTHRSPLVTFQTLLVLVLSKHTAFGWSDSNNAAAGLLGLANRHIFPLGLHRDPTTSRVPVPAAEVDLRRKLFVTYLNLEIDHCFRTGTPMMMRYRDFDVEEPAQTDNMHQVFLYRKFALLSSAIEITHSGKTAPTTSQVAGCLRELASAAETLKSALHIDPKSSSNIPDLLRFTLLAVLINRIHAALLVPVLEHAKPSARAQYTTDLTAPANDVMDLIASLLKSLETLASPESQFGWKIFLLSQVQTSIFSVAAFNLVFLQRSLSDPSLLALRGNAPDSAQQFRKIRNLFKLTSLVANLSRIGVKSHLGFTSYLRTVEERFRMYIENGQAEIDLTKDEGRPLLFAVAQTMEQELDELEKAIQENGLLDGLPRTEVMKLEAAATPAIDWQKTDNLLDGFDWPWTDIMFESNWGLPVTGVGT